MLALVPPLRGCKTRCAEHLSHHGPGRTALILFVALSENNKTIFPYHNKNLPFKYNHRRMRDIVHTAQGVDGVFDCVLLSLISGKDALAYTFPILFEFFFLKQSAKTTKNTEIFALGTARCDVGCCGFSGQKISTRKGFE